MAMIRAYSDLDVWKKSMDLVVAIYNASKSFPREETFCLTSQLRRSAVSVPSNLAEGHSRKSTAEFLRHISIAQGSLSELETQVLICERLGYLNGATRDGLLKASAEIGRMLNGLLASLSARQR
jgi:four helix bundle protein